MNSPQLWGTGLGVLVCYLRWGGVVAGTTVLCVEQNSIGSSKQGLLGVALQRRSWAPTFVWQVELMTQEDVPWSRAIWFRGKAGGAAGRKRSRSGPTSFARLLASCFLRSNLTLVDQVALARSIPSAWSSPFLVSSTWIA